MRCTVARFSLMVVLITAMVGAACSRAVQAGDTDAPLLTFTNESIDMATVYVSRPGGELRRITSVMPGRTDTLSLPSIVTSGSTVTIVAVQMAGTQVASSGPISIGPGVRLAIRLNASGNALSVLPARQP
jgi:hypothetical protein